MGFLENVYTVTRPSKSIVTRGATWDHKVWLRYLEPRILNVKLLDASESGKQFSSSL